MCRSSVRQYFDCKMSGIKFYDSGESINNVLYGMSIFWLLKLFMSYLVLSKSGSLDLFS